MKIIELSKRKKEKPLFTLTITHTTFPSTNTASISNALINPTLSLPISLTSTSIYANPTFIPNTYNDNDNEPLASKYQINNLLKRILEISLPLFAVFMLIALLFTYCMFKRKLKQRKNLKILEMLHEQQLQQRSNCSISKSSASSFEIKENTKIRWKSVISSRKSGIHEFYDEIEEKKNSEIGKHAVKEKLHPTGDANLKSILKVKENPIINKSLPWQSSVQAWLLNKADANPLGIIELNKKIFYNLPIRQDLIKRSLMYEKSWMEQGTESTKNLGQVRGSTRKPFPQKGRGKARVGTLRAPNFKGGYNVHGDRPHNKKINIQKKVYDAAIRAALSAKFQQSQVIILNDLTLDNDDKSSLRSLIKTFGLEGRKIYFIYGNEEPEKFLIRSSNQFIYKKPDVDNPKLVNGEKPILVTSARNVSVGPLLDFEILVLDKLAVEVLEQIFPSLIRKNGLTASNNLLKNLVRPYSSEKDPKETALNLINMFPGKNMVAKTSSILAASSIAAFAISKEIYIIDAEFLEMWCIFGAYFVWYKAFGEAAKEYLRERKENVRRVLNEARNDHQAVVQERMNHIGKLSDVVEVTENLYGMSKELAKMEAEIFELKQRVNFQQEVKSTLDSWVRHEQSVREKQQQLLAASVIESVTAKLRTPRMYDQILAQTLADVEQLTKKA
ncbi:atp4 subunit B of the stator stalk of mitochondrial F1F0 ATP synthase [Clydaea vesicula]|uniref:Large ribosomal subunit protein uL4m n=1 Tax=Clydaea vesicula TaxID=447962 RepID=A0AAD5XZ93_9FUNG|nr:atp4 subunit B of the stator stalk of mitochondrial F1F0 ATP synthase [Clydaea vesicula]